MNYIGWKDQLSKVQFTKRQCSYANQLKAQSNYTLQIIINGKHKLIGSYKNEIKTLANEELKLHSNFDIIIKKATIVNNLLTVEIETNKYPNSIVNLDLVKMKEFTSINRGENRGLQQTSYNIVFNFKSIANVTRNNHEAISTSIQLGHHPII